jgi:lambda family phage portal protein
MFQKVRGKAGGKYMFCLAPIDPALCDVDYSMPMQNGREIVQGVERDAFGRATAFYFRDHVDLLGHYAGTPRRVPASEIIHGYWVEGPGQVRGFPDAVGALIALHMLDKVSEAEVTAVRLAACKMGFYQNEAGTGVAVLGDSKEGADLVSEAEPGVFQILPNGVQFKDFDPKHPTANYRDFVKTQLREVAAGLRLSYNDFANDLEGVNFSSIRGGVLAERDSWMVQQGWLVEHLCRPVFAAWLEMFLLSGQSMLPMSKYDKFHADTWIPRRWQWVDPLKDAEANKVMREQNWKSDQQIVSEQGNDLDEVLEQIESDQETKKELGIASPPPAAPQLTPAPNDKDGEE